MKKHVRFVQGNVTDTREYHPVQLSRGAALFGMQKTGDKFKSRRTGPVSPEKLARLQKAANDEIRSRGKYKKVEKRGRFTIYYS